MKGDKEFAGTLTGFDEYANMVLADVTELCVRAARLPAARAPTAPGAVVPPRHRRSRRVPRSHGRRVRSRGPTRLRSEHTPEGRRTNKLEQILLNGNNVCLVRARAAACGPAR